MKLSLFDRPSIDEKIRFYRSLLSFVRAGIPLLKSLKLLSQQFSRLSLREKIKALALNIERGESFSGALGKVVDFSSEIERSLILAGEKQGKLSQSLKDIILGLESQKSFSKSLRSVLAYPLFLFALSIIMLFVLAFFILPVLEAFLEIELNFYFIKALAFLLPLLFLSFLLLGLIFRQAFFLRLPFLGSILKEMILLRSLRSLTSLISAGVSLRDSLEIVAQVAGNKAFEKVFLQVKEEVEFGSKIADSMARKSAFPKILVEFVAAGEKSGSLSLMIAFASDYYEDDLKVKVREFGQFVAPLLILLVAVLVGVIMIMIFSATISMMETISLE